MIAALTDFEAGGTPIDELDGSLRLDGGDRGVHVFRHHVTSEEQTARDVLAVTRIALHHLVRWFVISATVN